MYIDYVSNPSILETSVITIYDVYKVRHWYAITEIHDHILQVLSYIYYDIYLSHVRDMHNRTWIVVVLLFSVFHSETVLGQIVGSVAVQAVVCWAGSYFFLELFGPEGVRKRGRSVQSLNIWSVCG